MSVETFLNGRVTLFCGDSRDVLKSIPDSSIDSVVCDPPYALVSIMKRFGADGAAACVVPEGGSGAYARASAGFMGKTWDTGETAFAVEFWREILRVLRPGGHVVAMAGTRTYHRLACAIEDAGFEIRDAIVEFLSADPAGRAFVESLSETQLGAFKRLAAIIGFEGMLGWVYGSGFPKSHNVAKSIDKAHGVEGEKIATGDAVKRMIPGAEQHKGGWEKNDGRSFLPHNYVPASADAAPWEGWGTALKPAIEPICLARKPLAKGMTVASNVLAHGTGAINIDGCRIESGPDHAEKCASVVGLGSNRTGDVYGEWKGVREDSYKAAGRWPANVIHDGSDEVVVLFPEGDGARGGNPREKTGTQGVCFGKGLQAGGDRVVRNDFGSAARFFYTAKADADDRLGSKHPTVKPVDLMQWLCRLVTPKGGTVLDPFAGTGTTGEAAFREGFNAILIEREAEYQADIRRRMALVMAGPEERRRESIKAKIGDQPFEAGSLFASLQSEAVAK